MALNQALSPNRRELLGQTLKGFLPQGKGKIYFQDPGEPKMEYPAILYKVDGLVNLHADNEPYLQEKTWLVTVIDTDPDSEIAMKVAGMRKCSFVEFMQVKGLNHTVYQIHF